ncbi:chromosome partitioning protein ParB [uncultured Desulfobacter sp.]|uniref:ParB/RepB/Spo0J family partition protein n=1 Tax=uncultured Desulfobacter sp. TaxID=240139 RepID=UPI0029F47DF7|nr:chromosome partitioning protein ParB [uncultured Desulfobacter sp.]
MVEQVEISSLDRRYEAYRIRSAVAEKSLLLSISSHGIREPLKGVGESRILLDGFKRLRCARKLNIGIVPYLSLADDEAAGIIELIRISNAKSLNILEQARLIDELLNVHQMSNAEIAELLERSKAWVSVRSGLICQMSQTVMDKIFNGQFPAYSFMYTLRQFMRINNVKKAQIDTFVDAVAGRHLSTRDIDLLANAYFKGSEEFRKQIDDGNISWSLGRLKQPSRSSNDCSEPERQILTALEVIGKYMQRFILKCNDSQLKSRPFYAQANLLSGGILRQLAPFTQTIRQFYDRTGQA